MSKNKTLRVLNIVLAVLLINQWVGGTVYPKISESMFEWGHERAGILLGVAAIIHLALNWNWVKANYFKK